MQCVCVWGGKLANQINSRIFKVLQLVKKQTLPPASALCLEADAPGEC